MGKDRAEEGEVGDVSVTLGHPCPGHCLTRYDNVSVGGVGGKLKPVQFIDDPKNPRGRGRLDLATGERF